MLWVQVENDGPGSRADHAMAYDAVRGRTVLFGGTTADGAVADTWTWDGRSWTQVDDEGPSARAGHAMAFDPVRSNVVLFGGHGIDGETIGDTWAWDGVSWSQLSDIGPGERHDHAMAFDAARGHVLLFGGQLDGRPLGDTWAWDGVAWTQMQDIGPSARRGHAVAFDQRAARIVLFGGDVGDAVDASTWEWDGSYWTEVTTFGPPPALGAAMFSGADAVVLFGGVDPFADGGAERYGSTWVWTDRRWTQRQDIGPSPRFGHAAVMDTRRGRGVLFGGPAPDTWELPLGPGIGGGEEVPFELVARVTQPNPPSWHVDVEIRLAAQRNTPATGFVVGLDAAGAIIDGPQAVMIPAMLPVGRVAFEATQRPVLVRAQMNVGGVDHIRDVVVPAGMI